MSKPPNFQLIGVNDKQLKAWPMVQAMVDLATAQGVSSAQLLRGTGLFLEDIATTQAISARQILQLGLRVQKMVKSRDAGLQVGRMLTSSHMQGALSLFLRCRDLAHCIEVFDGIRWAGMPLVQWRYYCRDDAIYLLPQDVFGAGEQWPFIVEMACAWLVAVLRHGTGKRFALSFDFTWSRPRNIYDYEEFLGVRLGFDKVVTSIKIPRDAWHASFSLADNEWVTVGSAPFLRQRFVALPEFIQTYLLEHPEATAADVAQRLCLSLATLKRRLAEHNMRFKHLSDAIQKQHAIMMVMTCNADTAQLADVFSVTDTTNLRRFIKRLTGMTLTQMRNSLS